MDKFENTKILALDLAPNSSPQPEQSSAGILHNTEISVLTIHSIQKLEKLIRLLSSRNIKLLKLIGTKNPKTLSELSRLSGRPKASLTRTLARLSDHGLVVFNKSGGRAKTPVLTCSQIRLHVNILAEEEESSGNPSTYPSV